MGKKATKKSDAVETGTPESIASSSTANTDTLVPDLADSSLDQLFQALAQETKASKDDESSEFDRIQRQIEKLPKIESGLEEYMQKATNKQAQRSLVVKVDDPVTGHRKSKKEEPTDSGAKWFNMSTPELTSELKRDLMLLKNRSVLDPKRHYKKEKWEIPKFFHTGTIVEGNTEFYSRLTKKQRGKTLAEELLNDDTSTEYFDRKWADIQKASKSARRENQKKLISKRRGY